MKTSGHAVHPEGRATRVDGYRAPVAAPTRGAMAEAGELHGAALNAWRECAGDPEPVALTGKGLAGIAGHRLGAVHGRPRAALVTVRGRYRVTGEHVDERGRAMVDLQCACGSAPRAMARADWIRADAPMSCRACRATAWRTRERITR